MEFFCQCHMHTLQQFKGTEGGAMKITVHKGKPDFMQPIMYELIHMHKST